MILLLQLTRGAVTKRKKFLKKFLYYFKNGFEDETYIAWERKYKEDAHLKFNEVLGKKNFSKLLKLKNYKAIVQYAVPVSYTHLRAHETVLDLVCRLLLEKTTVYN